MKSFVALLSIKPHSPSVCPLYATVGAYRTFKYCLPIVRLCLTSMVTVTPKKIIAVYNKNWAGSFGFNWTPSSRNTRQKCWNTRVRFPFSNVDLGITITVSVFQNTRGSTWGRRGAHWVRTKVPRVNVKFNTKGVCFNDLWRWRWRQRRTSKKAMDLLGKTTILHGHHAFCYISLPSLCTRLGRQTFFFYVLRGT